MNEGSNAANQGVVTTTRVEKTVETTVEVREKTDNDGIKMIAGNYPLPIKVVVKNFTDKDFPMEQIVNEFWIPIRKTYRLVYDTDIVMCPIPCIVPELDSMGEPLTDKDGNKLTAPGTTFHFIWSKTYNDYGLDTNEKYVYQRLTRREKVGGDIRKFQDDPTKVRMTYVAREIYEDFKKSEDKKEERHRSRSVIVRRRKIPSNAMVTDLMEAAANQFIDAVRKYLENFKLETKPEVISFRYDGV
jgi:hypothetical protein